MILFKRVFILAAIFICICKYGDEIIGPKVLNYVICGEEKQSWSQLLIDSMP